MTGIFYKQRIIVKLNKYFEKQQPKTGLRGVRFLHDNAHAHNSSVVTVFLKAKIVNSAFLSTLLTRPGSYDLFFFVQN